jgi:hypothetical protein
MGLFDWFKKRTPKATATPGAVLTSAQLIEVWRRIVVGDSKSWVLFSHGTCVIIMQPKADLLAQAVELMREYGPVHVGSPAGDFSVITLTAHPGWAVTCHHNDILTYVAPEELSADKRDDVMIGMFGRGKRDCDASELEVIHVEDKRKAA